MKPDESRLKWVTWFPALMPAAVVLFYVSLAAHFRLASGHWPTTLSDDFSSPLFSFHERLAFRFAFVTFLVPAAWLAMLLFHHLRRPLKTHLLSGPYTANFLKSKSQRNPGESSSSFWSSRHLLPDLLRFLPLDKKSS